MPAQNKLPITTPWGVDSEGLPVYRILPPRPEWLALVREDALEPALPIIDPHHHLWELNGRYLLDELQADLGSGHRIVGTVTCNAATPTTRPPRWRSSRSARRPSSRAWPAKPGTVALRARSVPASSPTPT